LNVFKDAHGNEFAGMHNKDAMIMSNIKDNSEARQKAMAADPDGDHANTVYKPTFFVGVYSKGSGRAWVTKPWWEECYPQLDALVVSTTAAVFTGRFILNALADRAAASVTMGEVLAQEHIARQLLDVANRDGIAADFAAVDQQVQNAVLAREAQMLAEPVSQGLVADSINVCSRFPKTTAFMGSTLIAVAAYFAMEAINTLVFKDFYVQLTINNWDTHDWTVDQYHHDNGIIAGHGEFKPYTIPKSTGVGSKDSGGWPIDKSPTAIMSEMSSVEYLFQNSNPSSMELVSHCA
jgi:hypothetical protein